MSEHDRVQELARTLADCLIELDRIEAPVAAAHLSAALDALGYHLDPRSYSSTTE